jgi:ATP-binding cassette subfamily B protein
MVRIDGRLTLLALCALPFVAFVTKVFGSRIHRLFQRVQEQFATLSTQVQENLAGVRVVRAYAQEEASQRRFEAMNHEYVERNRQLVRWTAAFHPLLQGLIGLGFVAVLWYGGTLVAGGRITVGQFVTFNFFLARLVWPMIAIGWVINLAQRGSASWNRILQILETEPEITDTVDCLRPEVEGAIRFDRLTFNYPRQTSPALREIDLEVAAGTLVAIVGRTAAGKSTLLSLLSRQWDPPPGALYLDGIDVRSVCLESLRTAVAAVPQESFLFSASLAENVAFGCPAAAPDQIRRVIEIAGLEEDLEALPEGLETRVGERGVTLSGGQKQRVALARALLRDPRVLLLDDCLSAVDTRTEEQILARLQRELDGRTVFLVSHRISTVQRADLILVLDRGEVVERGDHRHLLAHGGIYADLYRRQQLEEELAAV